MNRTIALVYLITYASYTLGAATSTTSKPLALSDQTILNSAFWTALSTQQPLTTLQCLLEAKADINGLGTGGSTPLRFTCKRGMLEQVKYLVEAKADLSAEGKESTLLSCTSSSGVAQFLIDECKQDPNSYSSLTGENELITAVSKKHHLEKIRVLLKAGARVNDGRYLRNTLEKDNTALAFAVLRAMQDFCSYITCVHARSTFSPELTRSIEEVLPTIQLLLANGATINQEVLDALQDLHNSFEETIGVRERYPGELHITSESLKIYVTPLQKAVAYIKTQIDTVDSLLKKDKKDEV